MVKKYGDLYLQARRALLPSEGESASMAARELLAFASGKSVTAVLADSNLYASEQIEEKLNGYVNRMLAHEPLPADQMADFVSRSNEIMLLLTK